MIRVHIICEGQTEEMFINEILSEVFFPKGIYLVPALIGKPGHKGGNFRFERLFTDIRARLLGETSAFCTTFFDFYGLPEDFPGKNEAKQQLTIENKAQCISDLLTEKIRFKLGDEALRRFFPYVQMYEFEGLLFSDPDGLANAVNQPGLVEAFRKIRDTFETPENINNSPAKAPSKRIGTLYAGYDKPIHGSLAAIEIGLDVMRRECLLFDAWLKRIEALRPKEAECV
jgi:hypothetical protein